MSKSLKRRIHSIIICDDIRKEINNKHILIGVFSGDIVIPQFPGMIAIAIYLECETESIGENVIYIRILVGDNPGPKVKLVGQVESLGQPLTITLPAVPIPIDEPTTITLQISSNDKKWDTLMTKKVIQGEVAT